MTPGDSALIGVGELAMVNELLPWIADEHLNHVRWLLRDGNRWPNETPAQRMLRLLLLDCVCRRMVEAGLSSLEYLALNGDAFPDAPADASELLDPGSDTP